jgi:photosystem II stability/assembly factor-like uncharacterized protein
MKKFYLLIIITYISTINVFPQFYNLNLELNIPEKINTLYFMSSDTGFFAGGHGILYRTTNGGMDWLNINSGTDSEILRLFFVTSKDGWFYTKDSLKSTSDGGLTWKGISSNYGGADGMTYFYNKTNGWAAAGRYFFSSTDGGKTWVFKFISGLGTPKAMHFFNNQIGVCAGGLIGSTTDGGSTWTQMGPYSDNDAYFISANNFIICGPGGTLSLFRGFSSLSAQSSGTNQDLNSIHFKSDTTIGYTVGNAGTVRNTTNYGKLWKTVNVNTFNDLYCVRVLDTNNVWISGEEVLYTNHTGVFSLSGLHDTTFEVYKNIKLNALSAGIPRPKFQILNPAQGITIDSVSGEINWTPVLTGDYIISVKAANIYGNLIKTFHIKVTNVSAIKENISDFKDELLNNYPNPFNPATTINYSLSHSGNVKLTIYNSIGSKVITLVNEYKPAGNYSVQFNASTLASGIYLYRLESGTYSAAKKLILIK